MTYRTITFSIETGVARLTLNRPDRLNSFNVEMHEEVRAALDAVASPRSGARVLVLTGAGRGFCAGQDLGDRAVAPGATAVDLGESIELRYKPLVLALRALPMPVIAAVNGVAAGAGANIALACDLVIATRSATFIQSFAKIGLVPDSGGTWPNSTACHALNAAVARVTTRSLNAKLKTATASEVRNSGARTWCADSPAAFIEITSLFWLS